MNTQQLESFLEVAENLNFARAAENLNITQPAVSRQIHTLEEELGTKLFHRTTKNVVLTSAGTIFLEEAKNIVDRLHTVTERIHHHTDSYMQTLLIGCINEIDLIFISKILKRCKKEFPQLRPFLRSVPHKSILNLFFGGEIDVLFAFKDNIPSAEGILYKELFQIPVRCAVPVEHPFAQRTAIEEEELYSQTMLVCDSYTIPSKAMTLQTSLSRHIPPDHIYYCNTLNIVLTLLHSGYGFAILPEITLTDSEIRYIPFANEEYISYGLFYKEPFREPMIKKFISIAQEPFHTLPFVNRL